VDEAKAVPVAGLVEVGLVVVAKVLIAVHVRMILPVASLRSTKMKMAASKKMNCPNECKK
jgi:hypothetical protein